MSEFWESFEVGADCGIEVMGEDVEVAGLPMRAVVQDAGSAPVILPGGVSAGVTHLLQVGLEAGEMIADGDVVECRGMKGRVIRKEHFGGGWIIQAGPEVRWDGEVG